MFYVGQKVMCVASSVFPSAPIKGAIYTVAGLGGLVPDLGGVNGIQLQEFPRQWMAALAFRSVSVIRKALTPKKVGEFDVYEINFDHEEKELYHDSAIETFRVAIEAAIKTGAIDGLNESEMRAFLQASVEKVKLLGEEARVAMRRVRWEEGKEMKRRTRMVIAAGFVAR